ncbi:MAG: amino acid adenylation domain-containing protein, partial [Acidimicrobiia bacterium]|nr:amino acid adenylation domain-containing protein [Acidimicrobiia bacterium]
GSSLQLRFVYDSARFSRRTVESLAAQMLHLLAQFGHDPGMRLAALELLPPADLGHVQALETGPQLDPTHDTIHQLIARTGAEQPDAAAVIFEDQVLTYRQLEEGAARVAVQLQEAGVEPNRAVGLFLRRSPRLIVGMLGILKAGGAYVPLDPDYPPRHIQRLLEGDGIDIVLTDSAGSGDVPAGVTVVTIDGDEPAGGGSDPGEIAADPDALAYVIHTSGSTGRPKGVMVSHRNLVQSTRARSVHYRRPVGRFLLLSSFAFDSSVAGIFWTLTSGGTLVLPSPGLEHDINRLLALAATERVTHLLGLPALYELMLERADAGELDSLEVAVVAGEACPSRILTAHLSRLPQAELHNEYGPTEATVWCTVHRAEPTDRGAPLPIGRPIAGTTVHLLDEHGHRVPAGFVGELCVGGAGVTGGYLNRPDLTAERFATVRLDDDDRRLYRTGDLASYRVDDGALLFLGRADVQLKVRGHRIEPGAVEETLRSQASVAEAAVSGRSANGQAGAQLIAFVVFDAEPVDPAILRDYVRDRLPPFMVPDVFVPLDRIPRLPNGKVDVGSLPEVALAADRDPDSIVLPESAAEVALAEIWSDVLRVEQAAIHADSDFFLMGGHSLLAIRLMSKIQTAFGVSLPLAALFDAPRLSDLASLLEQDRQTSETSLLVPIRQAAPTTLYLIHPGGGNVLIYEPLARHLPGELTVVGIQARGVEGNDEPDRTIDAMAARYADELMAQPPAGPINLVGYSTGGLIGFEMARILEEAGYDVGLVALLDTFYPVGPGLPTRLSRDLAMVRAGKWPGIRTVADSWWSSIRSVVGRARHGPRWKRALSQGLPLSPGLAGKRITHIGLKAERFSLSGRY